MTTVVVPLGPQEWRVVRQLRLRALADAPLSFGSSLEREIEFDEADWLGLVARGAWFAAMADGEPVGMAAGLTGDGLDHPLGSGEAHLASFWVEPARRGQGIAVALLDAVRSWAEASGASRLTLWVADESAAARRFYARMGFTGTGRRQPLPSNPSVGEEMLTIDLPAPAAIGSAAGSVDDGVE